MLLPTMMRWTTAGLLLTCVMICQTSTTDPTAADDQASASSGPREPEEALTTFDVQQGFEMQLVAAEPLVNDPVAACYDENGLLYVVEMRDYPHADKATDIPFNDQSSQAPLGRVRLLSDTDGDGRYDESSIFAEELSWPSGIAPWKGGVFVTATPDVWYLKDTDGDHRADIRRKVFTGFRKFNVQAVINNPRWGLDHRIYAAGSSNGGNIHVVGSDSSQPLPLLRRDFCIDPVTDEITVLSGGARFGNTNDVWGNRFLCNIRNPCQHVVLPDHYLKRNRYLPVSSVLHDAAQSGEHVKVHPISPPERWRDVRAGMQLRDQNYPRLHDSYTRGYVTSSSGVTVYRGSAYPPEFLGNAFTAEVAWNLFCRRTLQPDGVTFLANRPEQNTDFVRSRDNWFRPVNFINAPDGTLHILDMYREVIEHPWSVPDELRAKLDFRSGTDRGRIYRLAPSDFQIPPPPRLGNASTNELVALLNSPNGWHRETAHRLIYERQDASAVGPLRALLGQSPSPLGRLHALWSLAGLDALGQPELLQALSDPEAGVREHAVRLSEPLLAQSQPLCDAVLKLAGDDAPRVRFQVAFSLGETTDARRLDALAAIASHDVDDPWIRTAVVSSVAQDADTLLTRLIGQADFTSTTGARSWLIDLSRTVGGYQQATGAASLLNATAESDRRTQLAVVTGLGDGLQRSGERLSDVPAPGSAAADLLDGLFGEAMQVAADEQKSPQARIEAIELLKLATLADVSEPLFALLIPRQPTQVQLAAVQTLASFADNELAEDYVSSWPKLTPPVRDSVLAVLMSRSVWLPRLMTALEEGEIPPGQISPRNRYRLLKSSSTDVRQRAETLLSSDPTGPRNEVIAAYETALTLSGDARQGQQVFRKICAACHRFADTGNDLGPPLATVQHRTARDIMVNILDPNREVSPDFLEYFVLTDDGRTVSGIIASEAAGSLTLKAADNQQQTILRENIDEIQSTNKSIMPEGLEKQITPQQMADLLAYLQTTVQTSK